MYPKESVYFNYGIRFSLVFPSAPPGRVIFEIAAEGLREEIARDGSSFNSVFTLFTLKLIHMRLPSLALKIVSAVLPVRTDFITRATPPRVGMMLVPPQPASFAAPSSSLPTPSASSSQPAAAL